MNAVKKHCLCREFPGATWAVNSDGSIVWDAAANGREMPSEAEYYTQENIDSYVPPVAVYEWTPAEFLGRFTEAEQLEFCETALIVPAIMLLQLKLTTAKVIRSNSAGVIAGMAALVSAGVLTQLRSDAILGGGE